MTPLNPSIQTQNLITSLQSKEAGDRIVVKKIAIEGPDNPYSIKLIKKNDLSILNRIQLLWSGNSKLLESVISQACSEISLQLKDKAIRPALVKDEKNEQMKNFVETLIKLKFVSNKILRSETTIKSVNETIRLAEEIIKHRDQCALKIQNAFRKFAFQKRTNNFERRIERAVVWQTQNPKAKKLSEITVDPKTGDSLSVVADHLKNWDNIGEKHAQVRKVGQSLQIIRLIRQKLEDFQKSAEIMKNTTLKIIVDSRHNMQSVALFKVGETRKNEKGKDIPIPLRVDYIATAPWNLRLSPLNSKKTVKGAGTALIESAIQESLNKGYKGNVALESSQEAVAFYKSLGFKETHTWISSEEGLTPMELSVAASQKFLTKQQAGRAIPSDEELSPLPPHKAAVFSRAHIPKFFENLLDLEKLLEKNEYKVDVAFIKTAFANTENREILSGILQKFENFNDEQIYDLLDSALSCKNKTAINLICNLKKDLQGKLVIHFLDKGINESKYDTLTVNWLLKELPITMETIVAFFNHIKNEEYLNEISEKIDVELSKVDIGKSLDKKTKLLHEAVKCGNPDAILLMLTKGADKETKNEENKNAKEVAATCSLKKQRVYDIVINKWDEINKRDV
ncbi:MAG: GNAT family N-acetyltransferase [Parachlamydiaceae bacterium]